MKKLIVLLFIVAIALFSLTTPAWAGDIANGGKIFTANCAACHMGGKNVVNATKTLEKHNYLW